LLARIAAGSAIAALQDIRERKDNWTDDGVRNSVLSGKQTFASIGFPLPDQYDAYLELGRFRNAVVLEEQRRNPTPGLEQFIQRFHLEGNSATDSE
jgi:hypothetical protein